MAKTRATSCSISIGGATVLQANGVDVSHKNEMIDTTVLSANSKGRDYGLTDWSASFTAFKDSADTGVAALDTAFSNKAKVTVSMVMGDTFTGSALVEDFSKSVKPGGVVEIKVSLQGDGDLTKS